MACYYPISAYRGRHLSPNGKRPLVFSRGQGYADMPVTVPCGRCIGCHLARAAGWAVRATHESSLHKEAIFLTLTYDDDHLPEPPLVAVRDAQLFLKRLRKHLGHQTPIRYLLCGEYGERTKRPHYHALIFGWRPDDAVRLRDTHAGMVFTSATLSGIWSAGLHEFGSVSPASAGYVSRYTTKKIFELGAPGAEFLLSSRRPPLGISWLVQHYREVYPVDGVRLAGKLYRPPVAYDRWLEINHPYLYTEVQRARLVRAHDLKYVDEQTIQRLVVRETIKLDQVKFLKRSL